MAKRGRWADREEEMRAVVERWARSGLPLAQFARREGIAEKTMYRWRRQLRVGDDRVRRGRPPVRVDGQSASGARSLFTEVSAALGQASSPTVMFEVVLDDGTTVRVPEHFDPGSLRILVATLREC
jgi:transposase-like protein